MTFSPSYYITKITDSNKLSAMTWSEKPHRAMFLIIMYLSNILNDFVTNVKNGEVKVKMRNTSLIISNMSLLREPLVETPPQDRSEDVSELHLSSRSGSNTQTPISSVTGESHEAIILELREKVEMLERVVNCSDKDGQIKNLEERISIYMQKEDILKNKIKYWEEKVRHVSSMTSKKGRVKKFLSARKSLKRVMRDVMIVKVFPFLKFCPEQQLHSLNEQSMAVTIMESLEV